MIFEITNVLLFYWRQQCFFYLFFCVCCEYNEHCLTLGLRLNWIEFAEQRYRFAASGKTQISINSLQCLFYRKTNKNGLVVSVFDSHTNARIPKHTLYNSFSFDTQHCYRQSVSMAFACVLSVRLLLSFVRSFALIHSSQHHLSFVESLWSFFSSCSVREFHTRDMVHIPIST